MEIISFGNAFNMVVKVGSTVVLLLYVVFAAVVIRQIKLMVNTLTTEYDSQLKLLAWIHLGVAVGLLIVAILV